MLQIPMFFGGEIPHGLLQKLGPNVPGFLSEVGHELAMQYNDRSPLENMSGAHGDLENMVHGE